MATRANFNSIKVRLEHFIGKKQLKGITFQFHKGAIRTNHQYLQYEPYHISIP